jgi:hypothetical protein
VLAPPGIAMVAPPEVPRNAQQGKAKGRSLARGSSDPMIEAGEPSTGGLLLYVACTLPTGDSHPRTSRGPVQRTNGQSAGRAQEKGTQKVRSGTV